MACFKRGKGIKGKCMRACVRAACFKRGKGRKGKCMRSCVYVCMFALLSGKMDYE